MNLARAAVLGIAAVAIGLAAVVLFAGRVVQLGPVEPRPVVTANEGGSGGFSLELSFGFVRRPIVRSVLLNLCPPGEPTEAFPFPECKAAPEPTESPGSPEVARPAVTSAGVIEDLRGTGDAEGSQFPASQLTVVGANEGEQGFRITVTADPRQPERVPAGEYVGRLIIQRSPGPPVRFDTTVHLRDRMDAAGWALFALILGALGGGAMKWLNDSFAPLAGLRRRQRRLERWLRDDVEYAPLSVVRTLEDLRHSIRSVDATGVSEQLDLLTDSRDQLGEFATAVRELEGELQAQRALLEKLSTKVPGLEDIVRGEEAAIEALRARPWPWPDRDAITAECERLRTSFTSATLRLRDEVGRPRTTSDQQLAAELRTLANVEVEPRPIIEEPRDALPARNWFEKVLDNSWWILVIVSSLVVAAIGYYTEFQNDDGFSGDQSDYLRLAAWAFAIELAGTTVVETAGRLASARPGAAGS